MASKDSDSFWVASAYRYPTKRVLPGAAVDARDQAPLTGLAVKSLITRPLEGAAVAPGPVRVAGFAWAGERRIARVDVSIDGGATWRAARLTGPVHKYAWRRFEFDAVLRQPEVHTILSRATDERGVTSPGEGLTSLVVSAKRPVRSVNGLITGLHEPHASHLLLLEQVIAAARRRSGVVRADGDILHTAYSEALARRYLWHEFGDSHLILGS